MVGQGPYQLFCPWKPHYMRFLSFYSTFWFMPLQLLEMLTSNLNSLKNSMGVKSCPWFGPKIYWETNFVNKNLKNWKNIQSFWSFVKARRWNGVPSFHFLKVNLWNTQRKDWWNIYEKAKRLMRKASQNN